METHDYDIVPEGALPAEFEFKYRGKDYVLREPSEEAFIKLRSTQFRNAKMVDGKIHAGLDDAAQSQSLLLSFCVYEKAENKLVPVKELKGWGTRVIKDLFERAKKMGNMEEGKDTKEALEKQLEEIKKKIEKLDNGDTEEERAKNSQDRMTDTSQ